MGLSRNALPKNLKDDWRGTGPLYVHHLAKAGLIKENVFAFFLESYSDNKTLNSFIDIGGIVEQHMHPDREIVWFSLKDHMYWMVSDVAGMRINGDDDSAYTWLKHSEKPYDAIFDSGTSLTMVPQEVYEYLMTKLLQKASDGGVDTEKQEQMYLVPCKQGRQRLPTLELLI